MSQFLAENVKKLRLSKHLTQANLAKRIGVDDSLITKLEKGKTLGSLKMLERLALVLDVKLADLLEESHFTESVRQPK